MPPDPGAAPSAAQVPLAGYTTLRLGGPARRFAAAADDVELVAQVWAADERGDPLLVLGGGSNLVVADAGFPGTVVHVATRGVRPRPDGDSVLLTVAAGEDWDTVRITESPSGLCRVPRVATWTTVPGKPASATTRLLPPPRTSSGSPRSSAARTWATSSTSSAASANRWAGPPRRSVVCPASGTCATDGAAPGSGGMLRHGGYGTLVERGSG